MTVLSLSVSYPLRTCSHLRCSVFNNFIQSFKKLLCFMYPDVILILCYDQYIVAGWKSKM